MQTFLGEEGMVSPYSKNIRWPPGPGVMLISMNAASDRLSSGPKPASFSEIYGLDRQRIRVLIENHIQP
jgi:hypothetical protein